MDVDPLASMRCWAIEIQLGGRTFDVPALPAVEWWPVLVSGDIGQILDFIVSTPDDPFNLDDLLLEGAFTPEELGEALLDAMEETAGRSFHVAYVIATYAGIQWSSINGSLARRGFRWDEQPLGAALDALFSEITSRLEKENLEKFMAVIENESLTSGKKSRRGRNREKVTSEFEEMAGPKPTAGVVATGEPSDSARPKTRPRPQPPRQGARSRAPRQRP